MIRAKMFNLVPLSFSPCLCRLQRKSVLRQYPITWSKIALLLRIRRRPSRRHSI